MSIEINSINQNQIKTAKNIKSVAFKTKPIPHDKVELSNGANVSPHPNPPHQGREFPPHMGMTEEGYKNSSVKNICIGAGVLTVLGLGFELTLGKGKHLKSLWEGVNKKFGKGVNGNSSIDEGKKYLDKIDDIKENFSKIFGRDYTKDEAQELALKYKEIFETEDCDNFVNTILERLKKDYNLPDFHISYAKKSDSQEYASWGLFKGGIEYNIDLIKFNEEGIITELNNRNNMVNYLTHELKHATQDKIANQVDIHKHIMARIDYEQNHNSKAWQSALREYGNNIEEVREKLAKNCYDVMIQGFKNLEKISEDSPLYQKGLEYIEGNRNYILPSESLERCGSFDMYRNQLIEKEAFDAGDRMEQIYKWLTNK